MLVKYNEGGVANRRGGASNALATAAKVSAVVAVKTSLTAAALTAGTAMAVKDGLSSTSMRVARQSFAKNFANIFTLGASNKKSAPPNKNQFDEFMKNNTLDIPLVGPNTIPRNLVTAVVQTQQSRVVANISYFLNNVLNDKTRTSASEIQNRIKELLLSENGMLAMKGEFLTENMSDLDKKLAAAIKKKEAEELRNQTERARRAFDAGQKKADRESRAEQAKLDREARAKQAQQTELEKKRAAYEERKFQTRQAEKERLSRIEQAKVERGFRSDESQKERDSRIEQGEIERGFRAGESQKERDSRIEQAAIDRQARADAADLQNRIEGNYRVEVEGSEPTFIDTRQTFAGKAAWEGEYSYVTIRFVNEEGYSTNYYLPVRVNYLPIPANEIIQLIVKGAAIENAVIRFKSLLKGHITLSNYLNRTDYLTFLSTLTKVAGSAWNTQLAKSKIGSSILINSDMVEFMREYYGYDIMGGRSVHKGGFQRTLKDTFIQMGIFDMFIVDEHNDLLDISGNHNGGIYFKTFPLSQIYASNRKALENTVISIQKG